jgi:outer membrane protein assembly factor BamB
MAGRVAAANFPFSIVVAPPMNGSPSLLIERMPGVCPSCQVEGGRIARNPRPRWRGLRWVVALAALLLLADMSQAQIAIQGNLQLRQIQINNVGPLQDSPNANEESESLGQFPYDRALANTFDRCQRLLQQKNFADGLEGLDLLLGQEKDTALKPVKGNEKFRSLKREALLIIGGLPPEGLEAYRLQFGAIADKSLKASLTSGDPEQLTSVVRRYFHTTAGYQAALLLARHHLDHGRPLAAALMLQSLCDAVPARQLIGPQMLSLTALSWHRAGHTQRAAELLATVFKEAPQAQLTLAGKTVPSTTKVADLTAWIQQNVGAVPSKTLAAAQQWAMFRGHPSRNATMSGGSPLLNARWFANVVDDPQMGLQLHEDRRNYLNQGIPTIPALQALAIDRYILYRTPNPTQPVVAVDFETGRVSWMVGQTSMSAGKGSFNRSKPEANQALSERAWTNLNYGGLSSDGARVFFIEESPSTAQPIANINQRHMRMRGGWGWNGEGNNTIVQAPNRLFACEIASQGKLQWVVGGVDSEMEPRLASATFLGPPLPLNGQLYVLAEIKQAICLVVLDGVTGKLQWQQELLLLDEQNQANFSHWRRISGVSPTYAEGLLLCPTSTGDLIAVDITQRTLAWIFQQKTFSNSNNNWQGSPIMQMINNGTGLAPGSYWNEETAVVSGGHVIFTSPESDKLYCLDLMTGNQKWELQRQQNLYVGGIADNRVILVGRRALTSLKLDDKSAAWPTALQLPNGSVPSGRGFISQDFYYLPVSTGEVLKIDLRDGLVKARSHSSSGSIPGNLICYRGNVLSMSVDRLEKYAQADLLKTQADELLAKNPTDWRGLGWRGEIALDEGRLDAAIADLRTSYTTLQKLPKNANDPTARDLNADDTDRTRGMLFSALKQQVASDYTKNRALLPELESLIGKDEERASWLRLVAIGSQQEGKPLEALKHFLALSDLKPNSTDIEDIDLQYQVRRDAWIQSRLYEIWNSLSAVQRTEWDHDLAERWQAVTEISPKSATPAVRRYVTLFGFHPSANTARERLLTLLGSEAPLESESLLRQLETTGDAELKRRSLARLASLYQASGRNQAAANYYTLLRDKFGDQLCLEDQTGRQWYDSVPANSDVGQILRGKNAWPQGTVEEVKSPVRNNPNDNNNQPQFVNIEIQGAAGGPLEGHQLLFDQNTSMLLLRDGNGRTELRFNMQQNNNGNFGINAPGVVATAHDHLLLLNIGWRLLAFDLLSQSKKSSATQLTQLWAFDFADQNILTMQQNNNGVLIPQDNKNNWGIWRRKLVNPLNNFAYGSAAFCGSHGVVVVRQREVTLLDPANGQPVWVRRGIPEDCEILADDEHLVLVPRSGLEPVVLRSLDGGVIPVKHSLPARDVILAMHGTKLVFTENSGEKTRLHLCDAVTGKRTLLGEYPLSQRNGAKADLLDNAIAVVSPGPKAETAQLEIFELADGRRSLNTVFTHSGGIQEIRIQKTPEQFLLLVNTGSRGRGNPKMIYQPAFHDNTPHHNLWTGTLHAFDRESGVALWPVGATLNQHAFLSIQPTELPVLTFVRTAQAPNKRGGNPMLSVLCLDKRTGRMIYQKDDLNGQAHGFDIWGDVNTKQIRMSFPNNNGDNMQQITLAWSDRPRSPEPPFQDDLSDFAAQGSGNKASTAFKSLFRAWGKSSEQPDSPFDPPQAAPNPEQAPDELKQEEAKDPLDPLGELPVPADPTVPAPALPRVMVPPGGPFGR